MMGKEAVALISLLIGAVIVGLILRFGASSVPLAQTLGNTANQGLAALTLANPNVYPYYAPASEGPSGA